MCQVPFFESLLWLDLGLNSGLTGHWRTLSWISIKLQRNQNVNEECDVCVSFDDSFKAVNHILLIVSWAKSMISRMVWNFISRDANVVLEIYRILFSCRDSTAKTWKLECNIEIGKHTKRVTIERLQLLGEIRKIRINYFPRGGARGAMIIVAGYGHGDTSSNPGPDWLHFI